MVSEQECLQQVVEKYYLLEEQKVELDYPLNVMNPREYPEVCFMENFWVLFFSFTKVWEKL